MEASVGGEKEQGAQRQLSSSKGPGRKVAGDWGAGGGSLGDVVSVGYGVVADVPSVGDADGVEDGGCVCGEGEDGLGRGNDCSSGEEDYRGERSSGKLV